MTSSMLDRIDKSTLEVLSIEPVVLDVEHVALCTSSSTPSPGERWTVEQAAEHAGLPLAKVEKRLSSARWWFCQFCGAINAQTVGHCHSKFGGCARSFGSQRAFDMCHGWADPRTQRERLHYEPSTVRNGRGERLFKTRAGADGRAVWVSAKKRSPEAIAKMSRA